MKERVLSKVLLAPIISEKSARTTEKNSTVVFKVVRETSKDQVKRAVESMFQVEVDSVWILNVKGKEKRFSGRIGQRSDWKKAYVKLRPGYEISFASA